MAGGEGYVMKWGDITPEQHLKWANVSTNSPGRPLRERGPFNGIIMCREEGTVPYLLDGNRVHNFAWWYDVELV